MKKIGVLLSLGMTLTAGSALAGWNVANTSQKGSILIFPHITVERHRGAETLVEISNDGLGSVHILCTYVNESKGRNTFDFTMTGKQTVSWTVGDRDGDGVTPGEWPKQDGGYRPGSHYRGELICFAVDTGANNQIAFNHLTGKATVIYGEGKKRDLTDLQRMPTDVKSAFQYNAWRFVARNMRGLPADPYTVQGEPGKIKLNGMGGHYDGCPAYNTAEFMPNGAELGPVKTKENDLAVVSCNQDLRQDFDWHLTKLSFDVWNSREQSFHTSWVCVDSVNFVPLGYKRWDDEHSHNWHGERGAEVINPGNFEYKVIKTENARFAVKGVASTQCPRSENMGLLGVLMSSVRVGDDGKPVALAESQDYAPDSIIGNTTTGAGVTTGGILWDPHTPPAHPK